MTGLSSVVRSLTAVPRKVPKIGMKATQFGQRPLQTSTVIEKCSTQGPAAPPTGSRHPSANSEKSDLDSISALRQKNLVPPKAGLIFCTSAPEGWERNVTSGTAIGDEAQPWPA